MPADPIRVQAVFLLAVERADPAERAAVLDRECGTDAELRQRVEALLIAHDDSGSLLDRPVLTVDEVPANRPADSAPPDPRPAEDIGTVVAGRYKLLQQIGEGGMGSVFMAEQTRPVKRMVAVKLIKAGMDSRQVLARFESERQALALMDHPNIAKVLDAGTTERGHPFFVMELVKGVPLTQFCDDRQLSVGDRLGIFMQICRAVQHAHQKGIIHRDLKPTNILVESHDGKPVPKVIDFGLAKAVNALPLTDRSLFTHFGAVLGTPLYMAPEQAEFSAIDVDTRADIYALGVILYELLTGTTPLEKKRFAEAAWDEIRRVIKEEEPQTPSARLSSSEGRASIAARRDTEPNKLGKFVRGELDWIAMKALAKERDRRYDTANAFAADVERFLNDEPVLAGPPTVGYKLRKFVHRHRSQVVVAAVLLFALVAGVAVSTWQAIRATRAEGVAEQRRREADDERKKAETQAASLAVDIDLKYCEEDLKLGLLRLAQTLPTIPAHAKELRECVALNILAWGQKFRPAIGTLDHNGYTVDRMELSPDGLTVMTAALDGTVWLWDSLTGKRRAILHYPQARTLGILTKRGFSEDGQVAFTEHTEMDRRNNAVRLWDVATGQLRATLGDHSESDIQVRINHDGSRAVTVHTTRPPRTNSPRGFAGQVFPGEALPSLFHHVNFWNGRSGRLIGKLEFRGINPYIPSFAVSPDGRIVMIGSPGKCEVWRPEEGGARQQLPGFERPPSNPDDSVPMIAFSPSGRSAITASIDTVRWWDTGEWRPDPEETTWVRPLSSRNNNKIDFVHENIFIVESLVVGDVGRLACVKRLRQTIPMSTKQQGLMVASRDGTVAGPPVKVSRDGTLVAADANEAYDTRSGRRLMLPRGHTFHPELHRLADDGRYLLFPNSCVADLAVEKTISFDSDSRFLVKQNAWVGISNEARISLLRKADTSLDAELLQMWCQVLTRGKLDEGGRYCKFDEATWEKLRQKLGLLLETTPDAQFLHTATTDRLYWLRQEIEGASAPMPLLDRLVAAEPTWRNYVRRAEVHIRLKQWNEAIRDDLKAARLAGDGYWRNGASVLTADWLIALIAQAPDRPREQYELALRWAEANQGAGISDRRNPEILGSDAVRFANRPLMIGLLQFRLGRYADAMATLRQRDVPKLSHAVGLLMSPWNLLTTIEFRFRNRDLLDHERLGFNNSNPTTKISLILDPMDLAVRAMCHQHLGQAKAAAACLRHLREQLGNAGGAGSHAEQALLREAETLIEGKVRP